MKEIGHEGAETWGANGQKKKANKPTSAARRGRDREREREKVRGRKNDANKKRGRARQHKSLDRKYSIHRTAAQPIAPGKAKQGQGTKAQVRATETATTAEEKKRSKPRIGERVDQLVGEGDVLPQRPSRRQRRVRVK